MQIAKYSGYIAQLRLHFIIIIIISIDIIYVYQIYIYEYHIYAPNYIFPSSQCSSNEFFWNNEKIYSTV